MWYLALLFSGCAGVVYQDVDKLLLQPEDLPSGVSYYTPPEGKYPLDNEELVLKMGQTEGLGYIRESQRITGWEVFYQRRTPDDITPSMYANAVNLFSSDQGAKFAIDYQYPITIGEQTWQPLDEDLKIGSRTRVEERRTLGPDSQTWWVSYRIRFSYKNVEAVIFVAGEEGRVSLDDAVLAAKAVYERVKAAPLGMPPVPTPTPGP